nr:hypothetical protein [Tanacetum cinerariifolium]
GNAAKQNGNQIRCYNCRGVGHYARNCTVRLKRRDAAYLQTQLLIAQKEEAGIQLQVEEKHQPHTQTDSAPVYDTDRSAEEKAGIQLQAKEYDLMAAAAHLDEIKEVNANCILMANLQQASTSVFAHVAKIEAIRIFLAFASYMGFIVYQMDVNSAFLYGTINEEVYVTQPPEFVDPKFPNKVYKVVKALYGLHHAPKACLIYVDDIIFGFTKKSWCDEFKELMKNRFQMSYMGELTFFLRLQVKQKKDGIFISQDKYVAEILKKFDFLSVKTASALIETQKPLVKDEEAADVDVQLYRFQVTPKTSHLQAVKRIFRYLKGNPQHDVVNFLRKKHRGPEEPET